MQLGFDLPSLAYGVNGKPPAEVLAANEPLVNDDRRVLNVSNVQIEQDVHQENKVSEDVEDHCAREAHASRAAAVQCGSQP